MWGEVVPSLGWLVGMLSKSALIKLTEVERTSSLEVALFPRSGNLNVYHWRNPVEQSKQVSLYA